MRPTISSDVLVAELGAGWRTPTTPTEHPTAIYSLPDGSELRVHVFPREILVRILRVLEPGISLNNQIFHAEDCLHQSVWLTNTDFRHVACIWDALRATRERLMQQAALLEAPINSAEKAYRS